MICTKSRVKGGSGPQNLCGGELRLAQHTREGSRELHTDFVCERCLTRWTAEDLALQFAQSLQQVLNLLRGGNANKVMESGELTMRLLRERKAPLASALSEDDEDLGGDDRVLH